MIGKQLYNSQSLSTAPSTQFRSSYAIVTVTFIRIKAYLSLRTENIQEKELSPPREAQVTRKKAGKNEVESVLNCVTVI